MRIKLVSIFVDDQRRRCSSIRMCLASGRSKTSRLVARAGSRSNLPRGPDDLELVLEPNGRSAASAYQSALLKDAIPAAAFESMAIHDEVQQLKERGVVFTVGPTVSGSVTIAVFSDTCGNLIQMYQPKS